MIFLNRTLVQDFGPCRTLISSGRQSDLSDELEKKNRLLSRQDAFSRKNSLSINSFFLRKKSHSFNLYSRTGNIPQFEKGPGFSSCFQKSKDPVLIKNKVSPREINSPPSFFNQMNKVLPFLDNSAKVATPATSSTSISSSRLIPITPIAISHAIKRTPAARAL